jgi:hypothetical protein
MLARKITDSMKMRNSYKILLGKPEGKDSLQRHEYRFKASIKLGVKETGSTLLRPLSVCP